jgi:hypothetical protein
MTLAEFYDRNLEEDDFIKNNFKIKEEKLIAKMTAYYFLFEQDMFIEDEEILDDNFKIKDFDNELEEKRNVNILINRVIQGINRNVNYIMNNLEIFKNDRKDYIELFNQYKNDINEISNNKDLKNLLNEDIKDLIIKVKNNIDNNIKKLNPSVKRKSSLKM